MFKSKAVETHLSETMKIGIRRRERRSAFVIIPKKRTAGMTAAPHLIRK
jgi:hypothetical protein